MADLNLPADLSNGDVTLTAHTPSDYWSLVFRGFSVEAAEEQLSPQEKAARTRAANKEKESSQEAPTKTAGNATGDES